ncbi:MAG: glycosyltransferase family 9 protein, partial [Ignavibacteriales bacterium]|nr:glycosyltransferase family 9 protein [Ignavibacteriales bacterium]
MFDRNQIKKIICIKPRGIGDIVLSTIILENLKNFFLDATIDYLTEDFAKDALSNNPFINKVITFKKKDFFLKVALKIRKEKYDIVFDLWSNPKTAQITFCSGIKYRVGYAYRGRSYAYNIKATTSRGGETHSAEHNLEILKPLNIPIISKNIHYYCNKDDLLKAKLFLEANSFTQNIIGIIPSGGWESKRCPKEKWVEICSV